MLRRRLERDARAETDGRRHLSVCGLALPRELETRHLLILGTTGTGKSVLVNQVLGQIIRRMEEGRTTSEPSSMTSRVSSWPSTAAGRIWCSTRPTHARLRWSFFNECRTDEDIKVLSEIIFRPARETSADPFWNNAAKAVFIAGLRYLRAVGETRNADIWSFFAQNKAGLVKKIRELPWSSRGRSSISNRTGPGRRNPSFPS